MRPHCDKHRVPLRRVMRGGRIEWACPYSHRPRYEERHTPLCRKCHRDHVYSEGLCYPCWYYRS